MFSSPEEEQHSLGERLEVVVPVDLAVVPQSYLTKHLKEGGCTYRKGGQYTGNEISIGPRAGVKRREEKEERRQKEWTGKTRRREREGGPTKRKLPNTDTSTQKNGWTPGFHGGENRREHRTTGTTHRPTDRTTLAGGERGNEGRGEREKSR